MIPVLNPVRLVMGVLFLLTACTKDPVINLPAPPVSANMITKVEKDGDTWETSYNGNGSVQNLIRKLADGSVMARYDFVYENGKLLEVNSTGKWKYFYNGNLISAVETYNNLGSLRYRTEFAYTNDKMTEKTEYYANVTIPLKPIRRTRYLYTAEGNVSVKEFYEYVNATWTKAEELHVVKYDTNPNTSEHLENFPFLPKSYYSVNNPLRENYTDSNGQPYGLVLHEYIYDVYGRPGSRKSTYSYLGFPDTHSEAKFYY